MPCMKCPFNRSTIACTASMGMPPIVMDRSGMSASMASRDGLRVASVPLRRLARFMLDDLEYQMAECRLVDLGYG